jgi:hypothetical protein
MRQMLDSLAARIVAAASLAVLGCEQSRPSVVRDAQASEAAADAGDTSDRAQAKIELLPTVAAQRERTPELPAIEGQATFVKTAQGIDLTVELANCKNNTGYPLAIYDRPSCDERALSGARWPGGEGVRPGSCVVGRVTLRYERPAVHERPWTLGGPSETRVIGRVLVVHDPVTLEPIACGPIAEVRIDERDGGPPQGRSALSTSAAVRATLAGICITRVIARTTTHECPIPAELADCASLHCALDACVEECGAYVKCLEGAADTCDEACLELVSDKCSQCRSDVSACTFDFCRDHYACAAPSQPHGPCSELRACCEQQGERKHVCLEILERAEQASGDESCAGVLVDWDFRNSIAIDPPCTGP